MASDPREGDAGVLERLCYEKCHKMDLANHKTAFNALRDLQNPHLDNLKHMGYSFPQCDSKLHNFGWTNRFDGNNGVRRLLSSFCVREMLRLRFSG